MTDRDRPEGAAPSDAAAATEMVPGTSDEPASPSLADAVAPETRKAFLNLTYGLVALVIFLAGVAIWPLAGPWLEPLLPASWRAAPADLGEIRGRLAALESRPEAAPAPTVDLSPLQSALARETDARERAVAGLREELAAVRQQMEALPQASGTDVAAVDDLARRLDKLRQDMSAVEENTRSLRQVERDAAAAGEAMQALERRVAALEKVVGNTTAVSRRQGLVLAAGQLAAAVGAGRAYADELARLNGFAEGDGEIADAAAALSSGAVAGVPTLAELRRRFAPLAGTIVRAAGDAGADDWLSQAAGRLKGLVTVRRTGEVEGDETDAIVARAEVRLADGDLAAAVKEVSALEGAAAAAAAEWRREAEARLAADAALTKLQTRAIALLGAS